MTKKTKLGEVDIKHLVDLAILGIREKKGKDITILNLSKINSAVTDFFIVCHGDSRTQVDAIADSVEKELREQAGEKPWHREGHENAQWILLDYVNFVVHIFLNETRDFYQLEALWADAEITELQNDI